MACALLSGPAEGKPLFEVQLANPGVSIFRVENLSTASEELTSLTVFIGDTDWNFDIVGNFTSMQDTGAPLTPALIEGDMAQDLIRVDQLQIDFTGFEVGDRFQFDADLDEDAIGNTSSDFRTIYWNNDPANNAVITLFYRKADQTSDHVAFTFPDDSIDKTSYTFLVPEPGTIGLLAFVGVGVVLRRRQQ
jgi:hypothetical protein